MSLTPPRYEFAVVLGSGFAGHTVSLVLDGREAYRRTDVTTNPATSQAQSFVATAERRHVRILVRVSPGDLVLSVDCDLGARTRVTISLIGKASLWIETDAAFSERSRSCCPETSLRARRPRLPIAAESTGVFAPPS